MGKYYPKPKHPFLDRRQILAGQGNHPADAGACLLLRKVFAGAAWILFKHRRYLFH